jgi:hypothetical protein
MKQLTKFLKANNILYVHDVDPELLAVALALHGNDGREGLGSRHVQTEVRTIWGVNVSRNVVREAQRMVNPPSIIARQQHRLRRRVYSVVGPIGLDIV